MAAAVAREDGDHGLTQNKILMGSMAVIMTLEVLANIDMVPDTCIYHRTLQFSSCVVGFSNPQSDR